MSHTHPRIYRLLSRVVASLPNWLLLATATGLSWLLFDVVRLRRALTLRNIAQALPTTTVSQRRRIARQALGQFVLTTFETLGAGGYNLADSVVIEDADVLRSALAAGKGCLILCLHMGNWEALAAAVSRQIAPTHVIVKKVGTTQLDHFASWLRATSGYEAIRRQSVGDGARKILRALKQGHVVGFVMDQYQPGAPEIPLFGLPTRTNIGLATFWRRTGAPVVPITIRRRGVRAHTARIWPALTLPTSADSDQDILSATAAFNRVIEQMIRGNPEQYFWLHDRWKIRRRKPATTSPAP